MTELRQQLGRERALEVARDVRDRVAGGREALREMLGDKVADRVNDALGVGRYQQPPSLEQARDYSTAAAERLGSYGYEMDRGMER